MLTLILFGAVTAYCGARWQREQNAARDRRIIAKLNELVEAHKRRERAPVRMHVPDQPLFDGDE